MTRSLGLRISKLFTDLYVESRDCFIDFVGDYRFHKRVSNGTQFRIDLTLNACVRRKWDLIGVPCGNMFKGLKSN